MKLTDLEPRWLSPNLFMFRCPHCRQAWLTCKNAPMQVSEQMELWDAQLGEDFADKHTIVPDEKNTAWAWTTDSFETMGVTPSIDASKSGHWHGFITGGTIV